MEWISVKDRLPEIGSVVDIFNEWDGRIPDVQHNGDGEWVSQYMKWRGFVTHWMKIEPPKGDSNG